MVLWALILIVSPGSLLEDAMRVTPPFDSLLVVEGRLVSQESCDGKGQRRGLDLVLRQGETSKGVRVPCSEVFSSLQPGAPLTIHFRVVKPLLSWPSFTEVWHATSAGKVLYSYSAQVSRVTGSRWLRYALAFGVFLVMGPLVWFLLKRLQRQAESLHRG
jgi:hypothetical protein